MIMYKTVSFLQGDKVYYIHPFDGQMVWDGHSSLIHEVPFTGHFTALVNIMVTTVQWSLQ